jgi:hypothetical protein
MGDLVFAKDLKQIDIDKILDKVDSNGEYMDAGVDKIVAKYCKQLDDLMLTIQDSLGTVSDPISETELDQAIMKLPMAMYFVCQAQEALGIREDVSKAKKTEVYNKAISETVGTIRDKESVAELKSQEEQIVNAIYSRAYRKVKQRMECASELLASLKKVATRRCIEMQLSGMDAAQRIYKRPSGEIEE